MSENMQKLKCNSTMKNKKNVSFLPKYHVAGE